MGLGGGGSEETMDPVRRSLMVMVDEKLEISPRNHTSTCQFLCVAHEHKGVREGWFSRETSGLGFSREKWLAQQPQKNSITPVWLVAWMRNRSTTVSWNRRTRMKWRERGCVCFRTHHHTHTFQGTNNPARKLDLCPNTIWHLRSPKRATQLQTTILSSAMEFPANRT